MKHRFPYYRDIHPHMGLIEGRWQQKKSVQSAMFQDELERYLQARNTMALGKTNIIKEKTKCVYQWKLENFLQTQMRNESSFWGGGNRIKS